MDLPSVALRLSGVDSRARRGAVAVMGASVTSATKNSRAGGDSERQCDS